MPNHDIEYSTERPVSVDHFVDVLRRSTLAARRPTEDRSLLESMLRHANLTVSAWSGERLVGIARSVTDFAYCCYLSDLAVDESLQREGIGRELIARTRARLGERCKIVLLAAPAAVGYYPRLGFERHESAWVLPAGTELR